MLDTINQLNISDELKKLLTRKKIEEGKLKAADIENNFMLCLIIGETINKIDEKIREIATEDEMHLIVENDVLGVMNK